MGLYFTLREKIRLNKVTQRLVYTSQSVWCANFGRIRQEGSTLAGAPRSGSGLALCLRFRNEAHYLREWIEYYLAAGVKHFFLYNNFSDDDFLAVLAPYRRSGLVDLIDWPHKPASPSAEEDCVRRAMGRFEWLGFFDADEFVVIDGNSSIPEFLSSFDHHPAVALNWRMFGSNGHKSRPKGPVIEAYTRRGVSPNMHVKCIVRPEAVARYRNPHSWYFRGMKCAVNERGVSVYGSLSIPATAERAWVNHYYSKSEEDYLRRANMKNAQDRTAIRYQSRRPDRLREEMAKNNEVYDDCALRYYCERLRICGRHEAVSGGPLPLLACRILSGGASTDTSN